MAGYLSVTHNTPPLVFLHMRVLDVFDTHMDRSGIIEDRIAPCRPIKVATNHTPGVRDDQTRHVHDVFRHSTQTKTVAAFFGDFRMQQYRGPDAPDNVEGEHREKQIQHAPIELARWQSIHALIPLLFRVVLFTRTVPVVHRFDLGFRAHEIRPVGLHAHLGYKKHQPASIPVSFSCDDNNANLHSLLIILALLISQ
jgi:hypothetical protein